MKTLSIALLPVLLLAAACSSNVDGSSSLDQGSGKGSGGGNTGSLGGDGNGGSGGSGGNGAAAGAGNMTQACQSPAPAVFGNALCLCGDFKDIGNLVVKSGAAGNLGSVGVNGTSKIINHTEVDGSWGSKGAFQAIGDIEVHDNLYTPAEVDVAGNLQVGGNMEAGGAITGIGRLAVQGTLGAAGQDLVLGLQQVTTRGQYAAPAGDPCSCDGPKFLDVAAEIDKARQQNDNGAKGMDSNIAGIGLTDQTFDTGKYFFSGNGQIGLERLHIKGQVSIYIDGSLDQIGADLVKFEPGATLDLYVGGTIRTIGYVNIGDAQAPSSLRVFIAGADDVSMSIGAEVFHGSIYAPKANLKYIGYTKIEGGLFANTLGGIGDLEIRGARPELPAGCGSPSGNSGTSGGNTSGGGNPSDSSGSSSNGGNNGNGGNGGDNGASGGGSGPGTEEIH